MKFKYKKQEIKINLYYCYKLIEILYLLITYICQAN